MKRIPLTQGKFAIVDDEDFDWLNHYKWFAVKCRNTFYVAREVYLGNYKHKMIYMHREIMNSLPDQEIDHKNRNGLDNRKHNLRFCTHSQNLHNCKIQRNNTSGFKGVCWNKHRKKWMSQIKFNGNNINLGHFDNKIDAADAYNIKTRELFGEFLH